MTALPIPTTQLCPRLFREATTGREPGSVKNKDPGYITVDWCNQATASVITDGAVYPGHVTTGNGTPGGVKVTIKGSGAA